MPSFDIETIEKWEKRVKYHDIEADSLLEAYQEIVSGEHSYDQHETLESGDEVLFCCEAFDSDTLAQLELPPEIGYDAFVAKEIAESKKQEFTPRELQTVLAALRYWQDSMDESADAEEWGIIDTVGHFREHKPLSPDEIEELCERLNSSHEISK